MELTQSLEDYIEAIWIIGLKKKVVRVKDLMKYFGYKVSSVNHALKILSSKKLISHEKYGYVELTHKGAILAQNIYEKHKNITKFITEILGVDSKIASEDACNIEHYLHEETYQRLFQFIEYIKKFDIEDKFIKGFHNFLKTKKIKTEKEKKMTPLSDLKKGEKGIIKKITAVDSIKQRLLSMGFTPEEVISIERVAPLGDPIDVNIKGYHLSLRKDEAKSLIVEVADK